MFRFYRDNIDDFPPTEEQPTVHGANEGENVNLLPQPWVNQNSAGRNIAL